MKKTVIFIVAIGMAVSYLATRQSIVSAQSPAAFTQVYNISWRNLENPGKNKDDREVLAQKADGSTSHASTFAGSPDLVNRAIELATGERIDVNDLLKMKSTHYATPDVVTARKVNRLTPAADCSNFKEREDNKPGRVLLGNFTFLNHPVKRFTVTFQANSGDRIRVTSSYASDLNCAEVDRLEETLEPGTERVLKTQSRSASVITSGPPDEKYFNIPSDYLEVPPSTLNIAWGKHFGVDADQHMIDGWVNVLDKKYYEAQKKQ